MFSSDNIDCCFLGNFCFSWFNIPSRATTVLAFDVAKGDLPLNSLLPNLLSVSFKLSCPYLSFIVSLFLKGSFLLPPQSSFLLTEKSSPSSSSGDGSLAGSEPSCSICSNLNFCFVFSINSFFSNIKLLTHKF